MTDLFGTEEPKRTRASHRAEVSALKLQHGIWTHHAPGDAGDWLALCVSACHEALSGQGLTEEEKANPIEMLAGYCRLLDEAGLLFEDHKTELEAVKAVVRSLTGAPR